MDFLNQAMKGQFELNTARQKMPLKCYTQIQGFYSVKYSHINAKQWVKPGLNKVQL